MERLKAIILQNEDWLMDRVLAYAKRHGYTAYTSTLREAWRLSISGLSASIIMALDASPEIPELSPEEDLSHDPVSQFGLVEAKRHRERGVDVGMFLGLMKYYRQAYLDLLHSQDIPNELKERASLFLARVFDRIEVGFCVEWWTQAEPSGALRDLQASNRVMTNEKNRYLTIFESVSIPLVLLNRQNQVANMNLAAAHLFQFQAAPGTLYYRPSRHRRLEAKLQEEYNPELGLAYVSGLDAKELMPWLAEELEDFAKGQEELMLREKKLFLSGRERYLSVALSRMLDISGKFEGILLAIEDVTQRKEEEKLRLRSERLGGVLEMAGAAAHEISQPLQTLMLAFDNLLESRKELQTAAETSHIKDAIDRTMDLLQKIQRITRYETMEYGNFCKIIDVKKASE